MFSSYFWYFIDNAGYFKLPTSKFHLQPDFFFSNAINEIIVTSVLRPVLEELQKYNF